MAERRDVNWIGSDWRLDCKGLAGWLKGSAMRVKMR